MSSTEKFETFFKKLREVLACVNQDVKEVNKQIQCSKYELPDNSAILKLIGTKDIIDNIKLESRQLSQELQEQNSRFLQYHEHVKELGVEMEDKMSVIEDYLAGYGYQKFPGKCIESHEDSEQPEAIVGFQTPLKGILKNTAETAEKENKVIYSLKKTPMLVDYGLSLKFKNYSSEQKNIERNSVKSVRKKLQFRTPMSSIMDIDGNNVLKYTRNGDDDTLEITEEFRSKGNDLLHSFKEKASNIVETATPEKTKSLSCKKSCVVLKEMIETATPEIPKVLTWGKADPVQDEMSYESSTPETPVLTTTFNNVFSHPSFKAVRSTAIVSQSSTPELPVLTCSVRDWQL